ncbi:MAG: hypothetical protein V3R81_04775 [Gammaproteobacteria bacterium]
MPKNDSLRDPPRLFRRVSAGGAIRAPEWNQFVDAFNNQSTGVNNPRQLDGNSDANSTLTTIARFEIETIAGDYLICLPFDGLSTATETVDGVDVATRVNVARPELLRTSLDSHNSVTFVYTDDTTRTASAPAETDETQVIVPAYVVGDKIYAMNNIDGDTGVITDADSSVEWIDINVDARAWAKEA